MNQQLLQFIRLCVTISDSEFDSIIPLFTYRSIKKNTLIHQAGSISNEFYFIVKGGVRLFYITNLGHEKTRHISLENSIIMAMSSFILQHPSVENIETLEDTELLVMNRSHFYSLVQSSQSWASFYRYILEIAYVTQTRKVESLITLSAKQRFELVMQEYPHYMNRLSNKILASYLDITQETLSRLKSSRK